MSINLGLEEALLTVNKSLVREPLDLYYQINECYGCPLERIKRIIGPDLEDVILDTRFKFTIEFKNTGNRSCRLDGLQLENHGHYSVDIVPRGPTSNSDLDCILDTIDSGDCGLCPLAIFFCFLILVTFLERFWTRIRSRSRARTDEASSDGDVTKRDQQSSSLDSEENDGGQLNVPDTSDSREIQPDGEQAKDKSTRGARFDSLDAFRGITITGMIVVNYGGAGYPILEHAPWDGITVADFVFPFFIFSMGASIAISLRGLSQRDSPFFTILIKRIVRRSLILSCIGLCYNSISLGPNTSLYHLRVSGVLQRLAVSYLVVASMYSVKLALDRCIKAQSLYRIPHLSNLFGIFIELLTAMNFLALYLYVSLYFEYSETCPAGYLGPGGQTEGSKYLNCTGGAANWLDHQFLGEDHLYNDKILKEIFKTNVRHDPEGILGYTTSIFLTIIGLQCGKVLVDFEMHKTRLLMMVQWIATMTIMSILSVLKIPINKHLWSLSFVATTGTVAFILILLLYVWIDLYSCQKTYVLRLLISAGKNSLLLYIGHSIFAGMLPWYFAVDNSSHLQLLIRLIWSTFVWLLIANYLDTRRIYLKL